MPTNSPNTGADPPDLVEQIREAVREELVAERRRKAAPEPLLTKADAAEVLGCTPRHVGTLLAAGEIASIKVGRLRRIPPHALEAYIRQRAGGGSR